MIYIIEGNTGAGRTTFVNSLKGFEVRKTNLNTLEEIKETLSKIKGDVVFDRMFGIRWIDKPDKEILELNEYLKTVPDLVCYKFMADEETSLERFIQKQKILLKKDKICEQEKAIFSQAVHKQYIGFNRLFSLMDVFVEKE